MSATNLTESERTVAELSSNLFANEVTLDSLARVEASTDRVDRRLWKLMVDSGLIGIALAGDVGGEGLGFTEFAAVCEQQGRAVAPVPYAPTIVSAMAIDRWGDESLRGRVLPGVVGGESFLAAALSGDSDARHEKVRARRHGNDQWSLDGSVLSVPAAPVAAWILVPAIDEVGKHRVFAVDVAQEGVRIEPAVTTDRQSHGHLSLQAVSAELVGGHDTVAWLRQRMTAALCAIQAGVTRAATDLTASYISERRQFGRMLAEFQGVLMRTADAHIAAEQVRATAYAAASALAKHDDAELIVAVAKWTASNSGVRAVEAALHLHGGAGNVLDHPLPRYYLWGKQIDVALGSAVYQEQLIGRQLAGGALPQSVALRLFGIEPTPETGVTWRARFTPRATSSGRSSLQASIHRGRPRAMDHRAIVAETFKPPPKQLGVTHWSTRLLAERLGISNPSVERAWRAYDGKPWKTESFRLSTDPELVEVTDICGLSLAPPENAIVLCVEEETQIQPWTAPSQSRPCRRAASSAGRTTTTGTAPRRCSRHWTSQPDR